MLYCLKMYINFVNFGEMVRSWVFWYLIFSDFCECFYVRYFKIKIVVKMVI